MLPPHTDPRTPCTSSGTQLIASLSRQAPLPLLRITWQPHPPALDTTSSPRHPQRAWIWLPPSVAYAAVPSRGRRHRSPARTTQSSRDSFASQAAHATLSSRRSGRVAPSPPPRTTLSVMPSPYQPALSTSIVSPPITALHKPPPWVRRLTLLDPLSHTADLAPLSALVNSFSGLQHQVSLVNGWIVALDPDLLLFHGSWDPAAVPDAIPDTYQVVCSAISGPGRGCVVAWRCALAPVGSHEVLHDCEDWLAALVPLRQHGLLLVADVHLRPKLLQSGKLCYLRHIAALEPATKPAWMLLAGGFNTRYRRGTALSTALGQSGCLHHV